jgi:hypothetical protein
MVKEGIKFLERVFVHHPIAACHLKIWAVTQNVDS